MKHLTRWLAVLLAVLMCVSIVACGKGNEDTTTTTTASQQADNTSGGEDTPDNNLDANGYWKDDLPDTLNYNNEEVSVLYWKDSERPEFEIEAQTGDLVNDAIFERNMAVEERLGVKLAWTGTDGDNGDRAAFVAFVENAYNAGDSYDIIATYSRTSGMLAARGFLYNLDSIEGNYINLEQPWWPSTITESITIGNATYFLSGDISTNVLHFMYLIWYNKDLLANMQLPSPVQYVRDGTWTLAKLFEMTADTWQDLDNNGVESDSDFFGFVGVYYGLDAFYTGSDLRLVELSDTDMMVISSDFYSEKAVNLVDILGKQCTGSDWNMSNSHGKIFAEGRALFDQNRAYYAEGYLLDTDIHYGIVPTPKYDESQETYISVLGNPFTLYGIMNNVAESKLSRNTAVIECWASEGYRRTTPALFELNMQLKYSETSDESEMFGIVHDTINFDLGRIFSNDLSYMSEIPSKAAEAGASWVSRYKAFQNPLKNSIAGLVKKFEKIQED